MYYAEGTHEPIIAPATFEQAKERLRKIAQQTANRKSRHVQLFLALSAVASSAVTVVLSSAPKCGTPPANTAE